MTNTRSDWSRRRPYWTCRLALVGLAAVLLVPTAAASDHADPINLDRLEGGITDLFVFPAKDGVRRVNKKPISIQEANELTVIFCVRRSLATMPPYPGLDEFTYTILMDLHSPVRFDNELERKRYGGTVVDPAAIDEDFAITIRLNNDTSFKDLTLRVKEGKEWKTKPLMNHQRYSGVRDDPFIFPMFFGTNVIAMVFSIPLHYFRGAPQDFLIWAMSERHNVRIDHVGRSQRTQLPRFDLLNTLHPREHVAALHKQADNPGLVDDFLRKRIAPVFRLRPTDFQPDVMFFTRRPEYPAQYPNGRQLEDDVARLTCEQGDCQLYELSFNVKDPQKYKETGGRPTSNDKEFSDVFPYLADPWENPMPPPPPELTTRSRMLIAVIIAVVAALFLFPWLLYFRTLRRLRAANKAPAVAPHPRSSEPMSPGPGTRSQP